jgi:hypothetical protein
MSKGSLEIDGVEAIPIVSLAGRLASASDADVVSGIELGTALRHSRGAVAFLGAVVYGQRAHRDMDPLRALAALSGDVRTRAGYLAVISSR